MIVFPYRYDTMIGKGKTMDKKVVVKLHQLTRKKGISLRELALRSDIRTAAISELANQKRQNINFGHIERIAESLDIDDIREIIDLEDTKD